jgi:hypothetical protein
LPERTTKFRNLTRNKITPFLNHIAQGAQSRRGGGGKAKREGEKKKPIKTEGVNTHKLEDGLRGTPPPAFEGERSRRAQRDKTRPASLRNAV